ncbi:MAG: hypothetical protein ACI8UO_002624 [Verrucomicrobiales bacterium]|jgi:hypothetical protein
MIFPKLFVRFLALVAIAPIASAIADEPHWAFEPLVSPADGDSVDAFVSQQLLEAGLDFSDEAEPQRLLRRVFLDLIGLPPTPEESTAFAADPNEVRFETIVDDLLNRPQYGERWGRHWLDLARYADSNGLHEDTDRPHAWRYRDYVIESFNADKPYGQFIREQLAGDQLDPENPAAWIATGFCRNGPSNEENVAKNEVEIYRLDQLDDILATTAQVFLGQTIQCARCHDHKTEPFTQADYYRLLAVFDNSSSAYVPFADGKIGEPDLRPVAARGRAKPPKEPHIRALTNAEKPRETRILLRGSPHAPGDPVQPGIPGILSEFGGFESTAEARAALAEWIASPENALTWRVMANRVWQHHFGRGIVETSSNFGVSGAAPSNQQLLDWLACQLRENGGRLKPLHKQIVMSRAYRQSSDWRSAAAQVDPDNTRIWRYPPHRLEAEVIRDSILAASGNLNLKPGGPGFKPRVPPEILEQSKRNGWPKVEKESSAHWRRSVYIYLKRQLPMPMLTLFDAPDSAQSCAVRFSSTTPTQALALLNDEFVNEQARYLARNALAEAEDLEHVVRLLLERTLALPADEDQLAAAKEFVESRMSFRKDRKLALADLVVVLFNSSQFVYVD